MRIKIASSKPSKNVILSEAKLQRSGPSPRGQAFNLGSVAPGDTNQRCFASLNTTTQLKR